MFVIDNIKSTENSVLFDFKKQKVNKLIFLSRFGFVHVWRRGEDTPPLRCDGKAEPNFSVHTPHQPQQKRAPSCKSFFMSNSQELICNHAIAVLFLLT